jgi:hypothetical protein
MVLKHLEICEQIILLLKRDICNFLARKSGIRKIKEEKKNVYCILVLGS